MLNIRSLSRAIATAIAVAIAVTGIPQPTHAQAELCFTQTNQCISGRFRTYWEQHGGLPVFGYPISAARQEVNADTRQSYLTQSFERNRFELHPENAAPYDVLLGRLGIERLVQLGRDWQSLAKAAPTAPHYFAETGHAIAHEPFWHYWSSHGLEFDGRSGVHYQESMALFGLPLSEPAMETNSSGDRVLTQWFERARFEDHGAKGVLLGLLGNELRQAPVPQEPVGRLKYFWPGFSPMTVWTDGSSADERGFTLHLAFPHATEPDTTITGGDAVTPPEGSGRSVTVRGQEGRAYVSATRMAVVWTEDRQLYMIVSTLTERELLRFADEFEALNLATFRARLQPAPQPPRTLLYFWPGTSPLTVWHNGSYADEGSFVLHLAWPHATEPDATISGGAIAPPPEGQGKPVTVRGKPGRLHTLGARFALSWTEGGQFYMIYSSLTEGKIVALANDLQALDMATFQARLRQAEPPSRLQYFWPHHEEQALSVLPEPHGGSFANDAGFMLNLYRVHSRQPDVTITGGNVVTEPSGTGRAVTVRGQPAMTVGTQRGTALIWTEQGEKYMIDSDMSLPDLLDFTSLLQVIDLRTFRSRIQPE